MARTRLRSTITQPPAQTDDSLRDTMGFGAAAHHGTSHEDIARRAYELYERRGGEHGRDWEDWLQAEREIRAARGN